MTPVRRIYEIGPGGQRRFVEWRSTDDVWVYVHLDEPGTPWAAIHRPTDRHATFTSRKAARRATYDNKLLVELDRRDAERAAEQAQRAEAAAATLTRPTLSALNPYPTVRGAHRCGPQLRRPADRPSCCRGLQGVVGCHHGCSGWLTCF
jgi:hypothetical protein